MSDCIYFDSGCSEEARRSSLYAGDIFVFSPRKTTLALCSFAQSMIEEAFVPFEPRMAQYSMPVEQYVSIAAALKPRFIHHPKTMRLLRDVVEELGCDLSKTYIDVPRLRIVTHGGYLTSGVGYAHHPHRDTWYSAPMCQLNWWLPIYEFDANSSMAFHTRFFNRHIKNGSRDFNYYVWNAEGRRNAAKHIKSDERKQPRAEEPLDLKPQVSAVCRPAGLSCFPQHSFTRQCPIPPAKRVIVSTFEPSMPMMWLASEALPTSIPSRREPRFVTSCWVRTLPGCRKSSSSLTTAKAGRRRISI